MSYHAVFKQDGTPSAFYRDDVHAVIPEGAVEIEDDQWQDFVDHQGQRAWDGTKVVPYTPPVDLAALAAGLSADIDLQAEEQRRLYITAGDGQMAVYLQKQTQAAGALAGAAATPPLTAQAGAAAYVLLAAEVGITVDPATGAPAVDVFGVARAVAAVVTVWLRAAAGIEAARLNAKAAIKAATTPAAAQAAHDAVAWPAAPAARA